MGFGELGIKLALKISIEAVVGRWLRLCAFGWCIALIVMRLGRSEWCFTGILAGVLIVLWLVLKAFTTRVVIAFRDSTRECVR